jgi:hypothetical protein
LDFDRKLYDLTGVKVEPFAKLKLFPGKFDRLARPVTQRAPRFLNLLKNHIMI